MNLQELQSKLNALYETIPVTYPDFLFDADKINGPFLVKVTNEYVNSKKRIIIVGQETFGWRSYKEFCISDDRIKSQLKIYEDLDFGIYKNQKRKYNSPFWNEFRKIVKRCAENIHRSVLWLNINMFDYNNCSIFLAQKEIQDFIFQIQKRLFVEQLKILEPNVIIFFAGINTTYESMIKDFYPNAILHRVDLLEDNYDKAKDCTYLYSLKQLPFLAFLSYHPNHLYHSGKQIKNKVVEYIMERINENK